MQIPRLALNVGRCASNDDGYRYALNGVALESDSDGCHAVATNGKMMIAATWPGDGKPMAIVVRPSVLTPLARHQGQKLRRDPPPPPQYVTVKASAKVACLSHDTQAGRVVVTVPTMFGVLFPNWKSVINSAADKDETKTTIKCDPRLLAKLLAAFVDTVGPQSDPRCTISIAKNKPITIAWQSGHVDDAQRVTVTALLMPMRAD